MTDVEKYSHYGLGLDEVFERQQQFGKNVLPRRKKRAPLSIFFTQFKNPLIYIITVAALISFILEQYEDTLIIGAVILLDTAIGFFQENKAENTMETLRNLLKPTTRVIRDGKIEEVESVEIVPDDLVVIHPGDKIPADGTIIETVNLSLNEAILTGESEPIFKNLIDANRVFMGTTVLAGRGIMRVTQTGIRTELGKIASSLSEIEDEETPLQMKLEEFGKTLTMLVLAISIAIFFTGILLRYDILEMTRMAVVLAIAAIPEGLIIAVTMILAIGMRKTLQRNGLVKNLLAVETLGSVTTICTDKTGTLTEGKMQVVKTDFPDEKMAINIMVLCNNLEDSLEIQLWNYVKNIGLDPEELTRSHARVFEIPFSSENKYMVTTNTLDGKEINLMKGAPDIVMNICRLEPNEKKKIMAQIDEWSGSGLKLLGLAAKTEGDLKQLNDYTWKGLIGIEDPIRKSVIDAIALCRRAGVKVKIITGDYRNTAINIAAKLGLFVGSDQILEGMDLEKFSDDKLDEAVDQTIIFCRVSPYDKLRIISSLQRRGEITAMIGDGVNDAPALRKANIGVSVGGATDVAQETASLILLDHNFKTLVDAVEEGRTVFDNIKKVVAFVLSNSFAEIFTIFGAFILGWPSPLNIAQILWIHLICDGPSDIALGFERAETGIMDEPPRKIEENILDSKGKLLIASISSFSAIFCLLIFGYFLSMGNPRMGSTIVFVILGIQSLVYIFSFRSLRRSIFKSGNFLENKVLLFSVILGMIQIILGLYIPFFSDLLQVEPLPFWGWGIVLIISMIMVITVELVKFIDRKEHETPAYELIFSKIHQIEQKLSTVHNLHNLSVDIMEDKTLLQFHFKIPAETTLEVAHAVSKSLEEQIAEQFPSSLRDRLKIISHIEPAYLPTKKVHYHPLPSITAEILEKIQYAADQIPQIKKWHHETILFEKDIISLSLTIYLSGKMNIVSVHNINDELESMLKTSIPTLKRCIIHSEPV
ncbi:MAG: HAD-IC family P-type ATPase [Promethearchaeota archaeon]